MENLYTYLNGSSEDDWDGHIHLFNSSKELPEYDFNQKAVGFMDLEYDRKNLNVVKSYERFIDKHYNNNIILLATGTTIEDIKTIYGKYPKIIKGFGELKCYDEYLGEKVPHKKISFVRQVCKFSHSVGSLPVYLHWDIKDDSDVKKINHILEDYPDIPLVLCHCGMCEGNESFAFTQVCQMMLSHSNLWVDISYTAMDFFTSHIMLLNCLHWDRVVLGSDINNKIYGPNHNTEAELNSIYGKMSILRTYMKGSFSNEKNIRNLFRNS